jgi:hypothetical protein
MALAAAAATFNAAMQTLIDAWETYHDTLSAGDVTQVAFFQGYKGDGFAGRHGDADGTLPIDTLGRKFRVEYTVDVTGDVPWIAGKHPLFWLITNDAGDIS